MKDGKNNLQAHLPLNLELAEAYIPFQTYEQTYSPQEALARGTLFPELYRPYRKQQ